MGKGTASTCGLGALGAEAAFPLGSPAAVWGLSPEGSRNPTAHVFSTSVLGLGQGTCWRLGVPVAAQAWPRV